MGSIISQTFADGADKGLQIENEEWGRLLSIGSDWTRLRIGILCNLIPDGTNNITLASVRLGFSNAANKHVGSGSGKLWYGVAWGGNTTTLAGGTLTYNAGSGDPYFTAAGANRLRQADTTVTGSNIAGAYVIVANNGSTARRSVLMTELKKSGTSMLVGGAAIVTGGNRDFTLDQFRAAMANTADITNVVAPPIDGVAMSALGGVPTLSNHDTNAATYGETVAAHVGWNKGLTTFLNIFAIEVYRHA